MADLTENNSAKFDMGSFDFATSSSCAWCHPGGGALEYDREGYRYDGSPGGLGMTGSNPAPKEGDYYSYVPGTGLVSKQAAWQTGGVAEVDCLLCHFQTVKGGIRYSNLERNFAPATAQLRLAASLGLVSPYGTTGLLNISLKGRNGINPVIDTTGWTWNTIGAGVATVPGTKIIGKPDKENCALCHFADNSLATLGPASEALGYTAFQKFLASGSTPDGDRVAGGNNTSAWYISKGRAEYGKRAESINDSGNPDIHLDRNGWTCATCHYALSGTFAAIVNGSGAEVLPALTVKKIDHQFAKGNDFPDGKNMDQLDNTVTCESCHITRTHPNVGTFSPPPPDPAAAHAGFPALHFQKIACKACHVPEMNFNKKQTVADYSVGPYRMDERGQFICGQDNLTWPPTTTIVTCPATIPGPLHLKPLYVYRKTDHNGGGFKIVPVSLLTVPIWMDGDIMKPTYQRIAQSAAEERRAASGDINPADGIFDWPLNRPQGGDTSMIVNTKAEITDMVTRLEGKGIATPVMNFYVNAFDVSHNATPKNSLTTGILGSLQYGGCVMCHSSSNPASPNYSPYSVGFFDKKYTLFNQPVEDDLACGTADGVVQTIVNGIKRVSVKFAATGADGTLTTIDLSDVPDCAPVGNTLDQAKVLGYSADRIAALTNPATAGYLKPQARLAVAASQTTDRWVDFNPCKSLNADSYVLDYGDGNPPEPVGCIDPDTTVSRDYATAGVKIVTLTATNSVVGLSDTLILPIYAVEKNAAPRADSVSASVSATTATLNFVNLSPDTVKIFVDWNDGKGNNYNAPFGAISHNYTTGKGKYYVGITLIDNLGVRTTYKVTATIN